MSVRHLPALLVAFAVVAGAVFVGTTLGARQEDPFPHARHQGLFPLCTGCHVGIPAGEAEEWYPEPASCTGCHDGVARPAVNWGGASQRVDNLDFDHTEHAARLVTNGETTQACASCHVEEGGGRMEVADRIQVDSCLACHGDETADHYDIETACESCHVPLASSGFPIDRIEALPRPASHDDERFVAEVHGRQAVGRSDRCATCHTQERCATCHVDAERIEIAALPRAPASMVLPPARSFYPEPESHLDEGWVNEHQVQATARDCSTCHTTDDCRTCHVASVPDLVAALPRRADVSAPGVHLEARSPESHASLFFMQAHTVLAASDPTTCTTCHEERFCVSCHESAVGDGYHPANFMVRHSADAYGRDSECSNCHESSAFCRECHVDLGLTGSRVLARGYHDASPVWLLRHGQAARQNVESCASCHRQVDCTRCHSVLGAFKVSPHPPDFDAERAWLTSPRTCLACHVGNPLIGEEP